MKWNVERLESRYPDNWSIRFNEWFEIIVELD